jgi:lipid-binding SYLF domain-containing protein
VQYGPPSDSTQSGVELSKFEASHGYSLGVDAQVAVVSKGVGGAYDTETLKKPILGFVFDEKGLIGDVSLTARRSTRSRRSSIVEHSSRNIGIVCVP